MPDGETPEQAIANLRDAIGAWIEVATEEGRPVPAPMTAEDVAREQRKAEEQLRAVGMQDQRTNRPPHPAALRPNCPIPLVQVAGGTIPRHERSKYYPWVYSKMPIAREPA